MRERGLVLREWDGPATATKTFSKKCPTKNVPQKMSHKKCNFYIFVLGFTRAGALEPMRAGALYVELARVYEYEAEKVSFSGHITPGVNKFSVASRPCEPG